MGECYHKGTLDMAPAVAELVSAGKLKNGGCKGEICDWKVPIDQRDAKGQDVSCYGSTDASCPDPRNAGG